jgi:acetyl esterase
LTEYVGMPHGYFSFPKVIRGSIMQALAELCAEQRYALHGVPALDRTVPRPPTGRGEVPIAASTPAPPASRSLPVPQRTAEAGVE